MPWAKVYEVEGMTGKANAVALAENGDVTLAGYVEKDGKKDGFVARLDREGNVRWFKTYGGSKDDVFNDVKVAKNGDIIVAGGTKSFGAGVFLLRLPPDGELGKIGRDSEALVMDTNAVVKRSKCKVKKAGGLFSKFKVTDTVANVGIVKPKVKVLHEKTSKPPAAKPSKELVEILDRIRETVIPETEMPEKVSKGLMAKKEVEAKPIPKLSEVPERAKPAEETKTLEGFPQALLERYEPLEFLGEGGFARVYRARRKDGKIVALKIPRIDERTSGLFIKEVAAWYNLNHENIVRLYKADILPVPYLEMEFVEGIEIDGKTVRDLGAYPKPVPEEVALKLIKGIALGLAHAHSKGIYHLDLKPLNVLLKSDLTPKITDWGLAKISARSSLSRHHGYSPLYAAPEQLDEETFGMPDHRTDIYQLGLIFYELLTDELPYSATSPGALVGKILHAKPRPVSEFNERLKKFDGIFEKLLAKRKEDRYQSVEDLINAFESLSELEREKEELKKTSMAMRKSRSREEFERLKIESVRKTVKIAILSAKLNDKAELLAALDDLKFYTRENLDDLLNAIAQVELLIKEGIPISSEIEEKVRALMLKIEGETLR